MVFLGRAGVAGAHDTGSSELRSPGGVDCGRAHFGATEWGHFNQGAYQKYYLDLGKLLRNSGELTNGFRPVDQWDFENNIGVDQDLVESIIGRVGLWITSWPKLGELVLGRVGNSARWPRPVQPTVLKIKLLHLCHLFDKYSSILNALCKEKHAALLGLKN